MRSQGTSSVPWLQESRCEIPICKSPKSKRPSRRACCRNASCCSCATSGTPGHRIGQCFRRNEPLFRKLREADGAGAPAEHRGVVWRRILRIGLALGTELQPMKTEVRGELEERAPSPRQWRAPSDVVARVARQRE